MAFSASMEIIICVFGQYINPVYNTNGFLNIEPFSWNKSHSIMVCYFSHCNVGVCLLVFYLDLFFLYLHS